MERLTKNFEGEPKLELLVLRTNDLQRAKEFYSCLGFKFIEEKHGSGPTHYSTQIHNTVMEIYPGTEAEPLSPRNAGAVMLGLTVESLNQVIEKLAEIGISPERPIRETELGKTTTILDVDGRFIQLTEPISPS